MKCSTLLVVAFTVLGAALAAAPQPVDAWATDDITVHQRADPASPVIANVAKDQKLTRVLNTDLPLVGADYEKETWVMVRVPAAANADGWCPASKITFDSPEARAAAERDARAGARRSAAGAAMSEVVIAVIGLFVLVIYVLPVFIAMRRHHHQLGPIAVINIFLGWTFLGWVVALAWSLSAVPGSTAPAPPPLPRTGPQA